MKPLICAATALLVFTLAGASPAYSQIQEVEGYTFIKGETGGQVCQGTWVPPQDVGKPGICEGQLLDVSQFAAISARQSADKLDQLIVSLDSIDQRMAANNDLVSRLLDATVNTQTLIGRQMEQNSEILRETIAKRFREMPREILANEQFRLELNRMENDILKEVERFFQAQQQAPPAER